MKLCWFMLMAALILVVNCRKPLKATPGYDAKADPHHQLAAAVKAAKENNQYVFMQIGGDWCKWCKAFDVLAESDRALGRAIDSNYVRIKVNMSDENMNQEFFEYYGLDVSAVPYFVIFDEEGQVMSSELASTIGEIPGGDSYDARKLAAYFHRHRKLHPLLVLYRDALSKIGLVD